VVLFVLSLKAGGSGLTLTAGSVSDRAIEVGRVKRHYR
jgi:hypothetical protein